MEDFNHGSKQHTLTIRSAAGNRDSVIFTDMYACNLSNTSHVLFEDLSFIGDVVGVELSGYLENVEFHHCDISCEPGATHNSYRAVSYANTSSTINYLNNVRFIGNNIRGGYYNMYLYYPAGGSAQMSIGGVTIDSNKFYDAYYTGVYVYYYAYVKSFSHNTITNASNAAIFYGYYGGYYSNIDKFVGNRISLDNSSTSYGCYLYYYQNYSSYSTQRATFANNEIVAKGNGVKYGAYFYYTY